MREIKTKEAVVKFVDNQTIRDEVFERVIAFYMKQETFNGESIMQSDGPQIDGPEFLAKLADEVLKFQVTWDD